MRDIKFRAWDDGEGLMWYSDGTPDAMGDYVDSMERFWYLVARYSPKVMQYTDLKDKNGREIYEGDIAKIKTENGWEFVSDMCWSKGKQGFVFRGSAFWSSTISIEIIGNIHENPELLETS